VSAEGAAEQNAGSGAQAAWMRDVSVVPLCGVGLSDRAVSVVSSTPPDTAVCTLLQWIALQG
jgi:hypothetical protein